ncbi:MAG: hypothetical protein LBQ59_01565 [Candidatus Peribacteria bacterium]|nr:hypothetical protein [Candidatus Peribacteria bacterium]
MQTFTQDIQRLNSLVLKNLTDDTRDQQEKARLLFQEYLKANPDKLTLRAVTESTNSP